jgi:hypothetical protein
VEYICASTSAQCSCKRQIAIRQKEGGGPRGRERRTFGTNIANLPELLRNPQIKANA